MNLLNFHTKHFIQQWEKEYNYLNVEPDTTQMSHLFSNSGWVLLYFAGADHVKV